MTPQEYLAAEAEAIKTLPPEIVAAFRPVAFESYAQDWCKPVERLDQLGPWVDCMHEGTERIWRNLGGLTGKEFAMLHKVADQAQEASKAIGCERRPRDALLQAVIPWRYVAALMPEGARVTEFGPGSGYLGAILMHEGFDYNATEITQPFFLWQQQLWGSHEDNSPIGPWWEYLIESWTVADLIVACHMLNEMSEAALRMLIAGARCPILVEGYGSQGVRTRNATIEMFGSRQWRGVTLAEGPPESNHRVDLLLPPGEPRTVDLAAALKVLG